MSPSEFHSYELQIVKPFQEHALTVLDDSERISPKVNMMLNIHFIKSFIQSCVQINVIKISVNWSEFQTEY